MKKKGFGGGEVNRLTRMIAKNIFRLPGLYGKLRRYAKDPEAYPEEKTWNHIRKMLTLAVEKGNVDLQVYGLENIPKEPGFMLYGNHQGLFDVLAIAASCPQPLGIVYKKELKSTPILKEIFACTRSYPMDRSDARQSLTVIKAVTEQVEKGRNYVIFPEGTRSKTGNQMGPFHAGSFRCAVKAKCTVVPMAFIDCFSVLDGKGSKPITAQLHYLTPIPYEEYAGMKAAQLADLVKSRIRECIEGQGCF